jgi:hypothetical protein
VLYAINSHTKNKDQQPPKNMKNIKIPRRLLLKAGAHVIVPGSTKGGPGKSSTIITVAGVCSLAGLPFIVASYDQSNTTLERSLGKGVVVTLDAQTPELARSTLAAVVKMARENRAIILIDLPGAVNNKESVLIENIRKARMLERCDSFSLIVPVSPDPEELEGAISGISLFQPERVLIRARLPSRHAPSWDSFGPWEYLSKFPQWECEQWTQTMKDIITRTGQYGNMPPVPELATYLAENCSKMDDAEELDIQDVVNHLEVAASAIYKHILEPITELQPKELKEKTKSPVEA